MPWLLRSSAPPPPPIPTHALSVILNERPEAYVTATTFAAKKQPVPSPDTLRPGQALVRVDWISIDPAMRTWLSNRKSYIPPVAVGAVMRAMAVGTVLRADKLAPGTPVLGALGWRTLAVVPEAALQPVARFVAAANLPPSAALGVLGITGLTAFFGLTEVAHLRKRDVVVVSAAAGATGSVVAQIAKNVFDCFVVGIAGGPEKCAYLTNDLNIAAVDYKSPVGLDDELARALDGRSVDVFFDNVGGKTLETVLRRINVGARIVICGAISGYNSKSLPPGPRNYTVLISKRASMAGFLLYDYESKFAYARSQIARWIVAGKVKTREDVVEGLENAPAALQRLFDGKNIGKVIVKITEEDHDVHPDSPHAKL